MLMVSKIESFKINKCVGVYKYIYYRYVYTNYTVEPTLKEHQQPPYTCIIKIVAVTDITWLPCHLASTGFIVNMQMVDCSMEIFTSWIESDQCTMMGQ